MAKLTNEVDAACAGKVQIGNYQIDRAPTEDLHRVLGGFGRLDLHTERGEHHVAR